MKLLLLYLAVVATAAIVHATCNMLECTALPILRIYALFLLLKHLWICMFSPYYESSLFSSSH
jgi:hypothetical protein